MLFFQTARVCFRADSIRGLSLWGFLTSLLTGDSRMSVTSYLHNSVFIEVYFACLFERQNEG